MIHGAQSAPVTGVGLISTGGERLRIQRFVRAADAIWRESSRYYLLGYWPSTDKRELH